MKPSSQDIVIQQLEEKVSKYEKMLDSVLSEPKKLGKITAGPIEDGGVTYYRVSLEGGASTLAVFEEEILFGKGKKNMRLEADTDVVLINSLIIAILPEKLKIVEETPEMKLISWNEIGGLKSQLDSIRDAIETPMLNEKLAKELGLVPLKGACLHGPPGCGKTLIAKAVAGVILKADKVDPRAFTYLKGGELLSKYVGETEARIVSIFKNAREYTAKTGKRAVIFIDEAEAILNTRGSRISSDVDKTIVPTFLAEMDGFNDVSPFVLLSTNYPESLDEAILRPGRIDLKIEISRPDEEDVIDIFGIHLNKVKCAESIKDLSKVGAKILFESPMKDKMSGSLVETVVKLSIQKALNRKIKDKKCSTGVIKEDIHQAVAMLN